MIYSAIPLHGSCRKAQTATFPAAVCSILCAISYHQALSARSARAVATGTLIIAPILIVVTVAAELSVVVLVVTASVVIAPLLVMPVSTTIIARMIPVYYPWWRWSRMYHDNPWRWWRHPIAVVVAAGWTIMIYAGSSKASQQ